MSKQDQYLSVSSALCNTCKKSLPTTGDYIKCHNCGCKYHYSPCATLSESSYSVMNADRKSAWKCHKCRGERNRSKSPNNLYQEITHDDHQQQAEQTDGQASKKQQRDEDEEKQPDTDNNKRFKDSIFLNTLNSNVSEIKSDLLNFKSTVANDLNDIKVSINTMNSNITTSQNALREEMTNAFLKLTENMSSLATQVSELKKENLEKDIRIQRMENKINTMEQQLINKNIEIKNVNNNNVTAKDAVKTIAASVNVIIQDSDISNAYKIKRNEKIIVEFCSLNKKQEFMLNLSGHRVKGDLFQCNRTNEETSNPTNQNNFIYINDQLTPNNRRILWQAKTKARESGWKFVWVRNGQIYAKKTENSTAILLLNSSDIEFIN